MGRLIAIETLDHQHQFPAYCAEPARAPRAAIIVIQEIFGVNAGIRSKCDKWAEAGYIAFAPDLFWRFRPGIELDPDVPEQFQEGLDLYQQFDQDQGVADIDATIRLVRAKMKVGKVGCVGYCLGGRLAFMTAARTDIDASVGYYGVGIDGLLGEKQAISHRVVLHVPTDDQFVSVATQKAMHQGLDDHPLVKIHDYPGLRHGFAVASGERRDEKAAQLADERTAAFFAAYLG